MLQLINILIAINFLALEIAGAINMYSIAEKMRNFTLFEKHIISLSIATILFFGISLIKIRKVKITYTLILYILTLIPLIILDYIGYTAFGSKRWIRIFDISIQPSEIAKIGFVLILSSTPKILHIPLSIPPFYLTYIQPDLGTSLSFLFTGGISSFVSRFPIYIFIFIFAIVFGISPLVWQYGLKDYQKQRIIALLNPESDILSINYQSIQAKVSIGSGGINGKGLGEGRHSQLLWIPNLHSDFALVSFAEDFGFKFTSILIILYFSLSLLLLIKSFICEEMGIIIGVFSFFLFHSSVNILMILGLLPVVGIPLPFLSLGGTHNIVMGIILGLATAVTPPKKQIQL